MQWDFCSSYATGTEGEGTSLIEVHSYLLTLDGGIPELHGRNIT